MKGYEIVEPAFKEGKKYREVGTTYNTQTVVIDGKIGHLEEDGKFYPLYGNEWFNTDYEEYIEPIKDGFEYTFMEACEKISKEGGKMISEYSFTTNAKIWEEYAWLFTYHFFNGALENDENTTAVIFYHDIISKWKIIKEIAKIQDE